MNALPPAPRDTPDAREASDTNDTDDTDEAIGLSEVGDTNETGDTRGDIVPAAPATRSPMRALSLWPPPRSVRHQQQRRRRAPILLAAAMLVATGAGAALYALGTPTPLPPPAVDITEEADTPDYTGTWRGTMSQRDSDGAHVADWEARIDIDEESGDGVSHWTTFHCRGLLTFRTVTPDRAVLEFDKTHDPEGRCVRHATLTLVPNGGDGELEAQWDAVSREGTQMTSTGVLR